MIPLLFGGGRERLSLLCVGAHSDDIEIGAGGLILTLAHSLPGLSVHWCVLSAAGPRADEARASAADFLSGVDDATVEIGGFEDGYFPDQSRDIKLWLAEVRSRFSPDMVLVHARDDAHQDHRELNRLVWNLFRDQLILEYEIPKWDGDMGRPNVFAEIPAWALERKIELLLRHFGTQRAKDWFDAETFRGMARIRGVESRACSRYAEAFFLRKAVIGPAGAQAPGRRAASSWRRTDAPPAPPRHTAATDASDI